MSDYEINKSGLLMVQISGSRIRRLRESLGLTQLYLATAVGVTTETISRWERTESPTIKKENWIKLAAALEANPDEILIPEVEPVSEPVKEPASDAVAEPVAEAAPDAAVEADLDEAPGRRVETDRMAASSPDAQARAEAEAKAETKAETDAVPTPLPSVKSQVVFRLRRGLLWSFVPISILLLVWLAQNFLPGADQPELEARRIMPTHTGPGQLFPVVIRIEAGSENSSSLLIREALPAGCVLVASQPKALEAAGGQLKWLGHEGEGLQVVYLARCVAGAGGQELTPFSGSVLLRRDGRGERQIGGFAQLALLPFHWADQDRDLRISDEEILAVHDDFGVAAGLGLDVDRIEEMWLGSGYRWLPTPEKFEILP